MSNRHRTSGRPRGVALIEVLIASTITAVLFVAAVSSAAAARVTRQKAFDATNGHMLGAALMAELNERAYCEPGTVDNATTSRGRDFGELPGRRDLFDDVDDYHDYQSPSPTLLDGTVLAGPQWSWSVHIDRLSNLNGTASPSETGLRRVRVTVMKGTRIVARIDQLRSRAAG
ncbi:MAG TPA: prepilin-type N-terminal cleavage/methylation domain-containing protein [Tepidisphaeraceae bacterium]|jgi:prepilin-type N-terminal cleavage/methylation domain-containing protein|nr:prepilin-type N-terminal cleavage/methylation domain-containing protein [Tepidisphaeraceae bacterium]